MVLHIAKSLSNDSSTFMKKLGYIILVIYFALPIYAESNPCEMYPNLRLSATIDAMGRLRYYLYDNESSNSPYVDSICIQNAGTKEIVQTYYDIQPEDYLDISFLDKGDYFLFVYINSCTLGRLLEVSGVYSTDSVSYSCDKYENICLSVTYQNSMVTYDISNEGTITPPYVDSVWISSIIDTSVPIQTYYVQSGEWIDVSFLDSGCYGLLIHMEDCVKGGIFIHEKTATSVTYSILESLNKGQLIYYQGALYFKTFDGKYYDLLGRRVTLEDYREK